MDKFNWLSVFVVFVLVWMLYTGWAMYMIITRSLWPTVPMTYVCQMDGKNCEWKWATVNMGSIGETK
jgi:hypothetical protein